MIAETTYVNGEAVDHPGNRYSQDPEKKAKRNRKTWTGPVAAPTEHDECVCGPQAREQFKFGRSLRRLPEEGHVVCMLHWGEWRRRTGWWEAKAYPVDDRGQR